MPKISDVLLWELPKQPVLEITVETTLSKAADIIQDSTMKLFSYLNEVGALTSDVPYVVYHDWKTMYEKPFTISVGLPVPKTLPGKGKIVSRNLPNAKVISALHRGTYSEMYDLYAYMEKWATDHGLHVGGDCYEYYYNGAELDEEDYLTKVIFEIDG